MKQALLDKKIPCVVHFTNLNNVESIIDTGLMPRSALDASSVEYSYNDGIRLDGYQNSISLSISFPNYKLFYKIRRENPNSRWAVLLLYPRVLSDKDCAFFSTNAANGIFHGEGIEGKKGVDAFNALFLDQERGVCNADGSTEVYSVRTKNNLPIFYTTDPQAEVLCFEKIEPSYIGTIYFQSNDDISQKMKDSGITCIADQRAFTHRKDYKEWQ